MSSRECYIFINILFTSVHKLKINWEQSITCEVYYYYYLFSLADFIHLRSRKEKKKICYLYRGNRPAQGIVSAWNPLKVQECDIGRLRNQIKLRDHGGTMTTPRPISKSATQRANRQTADGQTDRGGREDGELERWSDRARERDTLHNGGEIFDSRVRRKKGGGDFRK